MRLAFRPKQIRPGVYKFSVGTAGSTTLVLQAVLPALVVADAPSALILEGGTHNPFAPPFDFLAKSFLPLVNGTGPHVAARLERPGFYPAGGGCITVQIQPAAKLDRLELTDRGEITARRVRAIVANLPRHIAERECRTVLGKMGWDESCQTIEEIKSSRGPGNVVMIELESRAVTAVFVGFGKRGVKAEEVAMQAADAACRVFGGRRSRLHALGRPAYAALGNQRPSGFRRRRFSHDAALPPRNDQPGNPPPVPRYRHPSQKQRRRRLPGPHRTNNGTACRLDFGGNSANLLLIVNVWVIRKIKQCTVNALGIPFCHNR